MGHHMVQRGRFLRFLVLKIMFETSAAFRSSGRGLKSCPLGRGCVQARLELCSIFTSKDVVAQKPYTAGSDVSGG